MDITKSTYELLEPIIAAINKTVKIDSVTDNGSGSYTLNVCNTLWATQGFPVTIQGNSYKITAIVFNVSITVSGSVAPTSGTFELYAPKFYHGTISVAEEELNKKVNGSLLSTDKLPMIWLHEPVEEINNSDKSNAIGRESECEIYFLLDANFAQWTQDDHFDQAIKPVRQLLKGFLDSVEVSRTINWDLTTSYSTRDLPRFGRYTAYSGTKTAVFAQYQMSGTKLKVKLSFIRSQATCC